MEEGTLKNLTQRLKNAFPKERAFSNKQAKKKFTEEVMERIGRQAEQSLRSSDTSQKRKNISG
jgi:LytS/YehU family sensor histidine kinase